MFTLEEILKATGGSLVNPGRNKKVRGVSIDSRTIKPNELFVPIRGERFDGHSFIHQALRRGAGAVLFSDGALKNTKGTPLIRVKDTRYALGALARYHRMKFDIPVVAVTGSNGKTSTKEMLKEILKKRFSVLCNPGTQNNYIGVSLSMLRLRPRHQVAVFEIGANHRGEINELSRMIKPAIGVITNIGPSHLEYFKTLKGVLRAKLELTGNLPKEGKLIINNDDELLSQVNGGFFRKVTFGLNDTCDFYGKVVDSTQKRTAFLLNGKEPIVLKASGRHNVYNALAGIAVARSFKISYDEIRQALKAFKGVPMRMQIVRRNNIKIIKDCYNSNPASFVCALDFLKGLKVKGKKVVVCGDMVELGPQAEKLHSNVGERIAEGKIDFLITAGSLSRNIASGARYRGMSQEAIRSFDRVWQAEKFLTKVIKSGDAVLIKGSRATQMERIFKCFMNSSIR